MGRYLLAVIFVLGTAMGCGATRDSGQSRLDPAKAAISRSYPQIVLYSVSWCPHCRAAKEYLTSNNIPFLNRDVELDDRAMTDLTEKYKSQGVPLIVIGSGTDEVVVRGFSPESFREGLEKARAKK